jgi:hypothetical protein
MMVLLAGRKELDQKKNKRTRKALPSGGEMEVAATLVIAA